MLSPADLAVLFADADTDRLVTLGYAAGSVLFRAGQAEADQLAAASDEDDDQERSEAANDESADVPEAGAETRPLVEAITEAFERADVMGKAVLMGALPSGGRFDAVAPFDEAAAAWAADVLAEGPADGRAWSAAERAALTLSLLTRVSDAEHESLQHAREGPDAAIARLAGFHTLRLSTGARAFATLGPGYEALAGAGRPTVGDDGP
ncbi:MAG: hypothetical protein AAF235_12390 [Planctomycetota bacterium]